MMAAWLPRWACAALMLPIIAGKKNLSEQAAVPIPQQPTAKFEPESPQVRSPASPAANQSANQTPNPARVRWDDRSLEIEASNSSLAQILREVAVLTGATLRGVQDLDQDPRHDQGPDQRIFGRYGPGSGCDVLSKLLEGSGYNVLMTGSRDTGVPLEIVLSTRSRASMPTAVSHPSHSQPEHAQAGMPLPPEPHPDDSARSPRLESGQDPFANGGPPRDPVESMQEILQRQQQIDQQTQEPQRPSPQ